MMMGEDESRAEGSLFIWLNIRYHFFWSTLLFFKD